MDFIVTLVAARNNLSIAHISKIETMLQGSGLSSTAAPNWLSEHKAADLPVTDMPNRSLIEKMREMLAEDAIDVFANPVQNRRKKLLIADMDSTIVEGETLDEIAAEAGIKDKIAPITERAMRGELDFKQALRERVGLLQGLSSSVINKVITNTKLNPGAKTFVQTMRKNGALCVLVSGGFTMFTKALGEQAGFHHSHGNILQIQDDELTGDVEDPILDKDSKVSFMLHYMEESGLSTDDILAIGDGANDLAMLQKAELGIGYKPKPLLLESLDNCIIHGDLTAALYAQGYTEKEFEN